MPSGAIDSGNKPVAGHAKQTSFESEPEAPTRSGSDIWSSQEKRDGYARRRLAEIIGEDGWKTIVAAEDPEDPEHRTAVRTVLRFARAHNIGWKSPARRAAGKLETETLSAH